MKNKLLLLTIFTSLFACSPKNKTLPATEVSKTAETDLSSVVGQFKLFSFGAERKMAATFSSDTLEIPNIPNPVTGEKMTVVVTKSKFVINIQSNNKDSVYVPDGTINYQGTVRGKSGSVVAVQMSNGDMNGMISDGVNPAFSVGKYKNQQIIYNSSDTLFARSIGAANPFICTALPVPIGARSSRLEMAAANVKRCPALFWEIKYDLVTTLGGLTAATNFINSLYNQVVAVNAIDSITFSSLSTYFWVTQDPYIGTTAADFLTKFQQIRTTIYGDIGTLMGATGNGGIGFVGGIGGSYSRCYCMILPYFSTLPTWSWTVNVVCHEQDHVMGASHSFCCIYNNNNTAIDSSNSCWGLGTEGGCPNNQISDLSQVNAVMSYAHGCPSGMSLIKGVGKQIRAIILNTINSAGSVTACGNPPPPPPPTSCDTVNSRSATPGLASSGSTATVLFKWKGLGAGYSIRLRKVANPVVAWINLASPILRDTILVGGLPTGATMEWQVSTLCSGRASDPEWTTSQIFVTPVTPPLCKTPTNVYSTSQTGTTATVNWFCSTSTTFNIEYKKATDVTWSFINNIAWTSPTGVLKIATLSNLSPATAYNFAVQANCVGNQSTYSAIQNFTTTGAPPPPIDTCLSKPNPYVNYKECTRIDSGYSVTSIVTAQVSFLWTWKGLTSNASNIELPSAKRGETVTLTVTELSGCKKSSTITIIL